MMMMMVVVVDEKMNTDGKKRSVVVVIRLKVVHGGRLMKDFVGVLVRIRLLMLIAQPVRAW